MVAENKKINWRFNYFWKNKTKRQINSREMKKQKTQKQKSIGEQNQTNLKLKEKGRGSSWSHQTIPTQTTKSGHICE